MEARSSGPAYWHHSRFVTSASRHPAIYTQTNNIHYPIWLLQYSNLKLDVTLNINLIKAAGVCKLLRFSFFFCIIILQCLLMSVFIARANTTLSTLRIHLPSTTCFGRFWPSTGRFYNNMHGMSPLRYSFPCMLCFYPTMAKNGRKNVVDDECTVFWELCSLWRQIQTLRYRLKLDWTSFWSPSITKINKQTDEHSYSLSSSLTREV